MKSELVIDLIRYHLSESEQEFADAVERLASDEEADGNSALAMEIRNTYRSTDRQTSRSVDPFGDDGLSTHSTVPTDFDFDAELMELREPNIVLDDVVLSDQAASVIHQVIAEWESPDLLPNGIRPTGSLLVTGPSGCGKAMVSEAMANALRIPLVVVRSDRLISSLTGQTGANIRKVFDSVRNRRCVLFFDDFETVGGNRSEPKDAGEVRRMVASLLQSMDSVGEGVLVMAATDLPGVLDPVVVRRFDRTVSLELPDASQRTRMVEMFCRRHDMDTCAFADMMVQITAGMGFADMERLLENAIRDSVVSSGEIVLDGPELVMTMGGPWEVAVRMREGGSTLRDIERETGIPRSTLSYRFGKEGR